VAQHYIDVDNQFVQTRKDMQEEREEFANKFDDKIVNLEKRLDLLLAERLQIQN
jgi:hypothetical protein